MIKLMSHLLPLLVIVILAGLLISANIPISRVYLDGKNDVLGTHTSKGNPKIATDGGKSGFIINTDGAISAFPLKVDPKTGSLSVTTPKGEKVVAVLPDAAIKNMLASKVMSYVISVPAKGELASTNKLVTLTQKDDLLVYEIDGVKEYKLLGFIPLKSKVKAFVSAENGQVVKTEQSLLGRILNRLE
ncbi:hypothetical protein HYZ06_00710 [Candidatus Daviesbacteria bacterium]|nr:hypothetical protein [Candidatus Daviesbacteria bacterium]